MSNPHQKRGRQYIFDIDPTTARGYFQVPNNVMAFLSLGRNEVMTEFELVMFIIYQCSISKDFFQSPSGRIKLARYEAVISRSLLIEKSKWSDGRIKHFLKKIEALNIVKRRLEKAGKKTYTVFCFNPLTDPISTPLEVSDNQPIEGVGQPLSQPVGQPHYYTSNIYTKKGGNTYIQKANELIKFLFEENIGKGILYRMRNENFIIQRKELEDDRVKEEIFSFYTYHQENGFILQKSPLEICPKFESWLASNFCKAGKKKKTAKKNEKDRNLHISHKQPVFEPYNEKEFFKMLELITEKQKEEVRTVWRKVGEDRAFMYLKLKVKENENAKIK